VQQINFLRVLMSWVVKPLMLESCLVHVGPTAVYLSPLILVSLLCLF